MRSYHSIAARLIAPMTLAAALALAAGHAGAAFAGPPKVEQSWKKVLEFDPTEGAMDAPPRSDAVEKLVNAAYLTATEAADLRLFFGEPTEADLAAEGPIGAARRAAFALMRGAFADPALDDDTTPRIDRAEAVLERGDPAGALALLAGEKAGDEQAGDKQAGTLTRDSMRRARLATNALLLLGRRAEALAAAQPALALLAAGKSESPGDIAEAVHAAMLLTRAFVPGSEGPGKAVPDHKSLIASLKRGREIDPQHWPTLLAEAQLLYEKDNAQQASGVLTQILALNPACADAWAMVGKLAVDSFNPAVAERVACRLDVLAGKNEAGQWAASPLSAVVRARMMLRMSDPEQAGKDLAAARAALPARRDVLALEAAIAAARYDVPEARKLLETYDAIATAGAVAAGAVGAGAGGEGPGGEGTGGEGTGGEGTALPAEGYYEVGRALSEARQYGPAAEFLKVASQRAPAWASPLIDLGLMSVQSAEDAQAKDTLERAVALDPFNVRADNSLKLVTEMATYTRFESEHFIVRCKPGSGDELLAAEMLPVLEENHRIVCGTDGPGLHFEPPFKTIIDLMPDHRWFGVRITGMPAIHTIAASTGPAIAMETPREGRNHLGTYDWQRVLRHEYTHTVGLTKTNNRIPHWFTEAQAVYMEQSPRDYPTVQILTKAFETETLFDFVKINLAFVRPEKPTDRSQAYAQGHWMYEYTVKTYGGDAPLKLMEKYAAGVREEQAYREVLGVSREVFFEQFLTYAQKQLQDWGMVAKADEPAIADLLGDLRAADVKANNETKADADAKVDAGDVKKTSGDEASGDGKPAEEPKKPVKADEPAITDEMVAKLLEAHPTHPDVLELAVQHGVGKNNGEPTAAMIPLIERYAVARPVDPLPHKLLARIYLALTQPASVAEGGPGNAGPLDAIEHLEWLDAREDRAPTFAAQLAALYGQRNAPGDLALAQAKAERATRIAPFEARHRELAAGMALRAGDLVTARRHIEALIMLEPDRPIHRKRLDAIVERMNK